MKNGCQIRKALSYSDLLAKFHVQERPGSFKNVSGVTLILVIFGHIDRAGCYFENLVSGLGTPT